MFLVAVVSFLVGGIAASLLVSALAIIAVSRNDVSQAKSDAYERMIHRIEQVMRDPYSPDDLHLDEELVPYEGR